MTDDKLKSVFAECGDILQSMGVNRAVPEASASPGSTAGDQHLLWLIENGRLLVEQGQREKAMHWLGFIQGALWGLTYVTIDELVDINHPSNECFDETSI